MQIMKKTISGKTSSADLREVDGLVAGHPDLYPNRSELVRKAIRRELEWARSNLDIPAKDAQEGASTTPPVPVPPPAVPAPSEALTEPPKERVCARPSNARKPISSLWKEITLSTTRTGDGV